MNNFALLPSESEISAYAQMSPMELAEFNEWLDSQAEIAPQITS